MDSSVVAERLPAMCGRATLATEESSTTMNVASMTETATIHGLTLGTQLPCASSREISRPSPNARAAVIPATRKTQAERAGVPVPVDAEFRKRLNLKRCRIQEKAQSDIVARKGRNPQPEAGPSNSTATRLQTATGWASCWEVAGRYDPRPSSPEVCGHGRISSPRLTSSSSKIQRATSATWSAFARGTTATPWILGD